MSSSCKKELPVPRNLPTGAREAYQQAYRSACEVYGAGERLPNLDEIAHNVALASLEASYHKTAQGRWVAD